MDSFLTAVSTRFKGRQSLSCNDLASIGSGYDDFDSSKQLRKISKGTQAAAFRRRFSQSKSHSVETFAPSISMDRVKSKSSSELADAVDIQLAQIREKLAVLRKQDTDFHERMDSLANSIGELTSRSSADTSDGMLSDADHDIDYDNDDGKNYTEDDQIIQDKIKSISTSFSNELLSSIPTIKVTSGSYKRRRSSQRRRSLGRSHPSLHESAELLDLSTESNRHSVCLADYAYLYGSGKEGSTVL